MLEEKTIFVVTPLMSGKVAFSNKLDANVFIDGLPTREQRLTELNEVPIFTNPRTAANYVNFSRKEHVELEDKVEVS